MRSGKGKHGRRARKLARFNVGSLPICGDRLQGTVADCDIVARHLPEDNVGGDLVEAISQGG